VVQSALALAGAGPNARQRCRALSDQWFYLHDIFVLSQPCYDLFDKMAYMDIKNTSNYWS